MHINPKATLAWRLYLKAQAPDTNLNPMGTILVGLWKYNYFKAQRKRNYILGILHSRDKEGVVSIPNRYHFQLPLYNKSDGR